LVVGLFSKSDSEDVVVAVVSLMGIGSVEVGGAMRPVVVLDFS
jgi:hypothetical protein